MSKAKIPNNTTTRQRPRRAPDHLAKQEEADFAAAVKAESDLQTGMTPAVDFASKPAGDFPRGFNLYAAPGKFTDGNVVQTSTNWTTYALPGGKTVDGPGS